MEKLIKFNILEFIYLLSAMQTQKEMEKITKYDTVIKKLETTLFMYALMNRNKPIEPNMETLENTIIEYKMNKEEIEMAEEAIDKIVLMKKSIRLDHTKEDIIKNKINTN